jgi:membrane protease YdiL (CAAX protease family)
MILTSIFDSKKSLTSIKAFLLLIATSVAVTTALAPPLHYLLVYYGGLTNLPFSRVVDRLILVALLCGMWCLRRCLKVHDLRKLRQSLTKIPMGRECIRGVIAALVPSLIVLFIYIALGFVSIKPRAFASIVSKSALVLLAAPLIGAFEEFFFRLYSMSLFISFTPYFVASAAISVFYAFVHVLTPATAFQVEGLNLLAGVTYLGVLLSNFSRPGIPLVILHFFVVGFILSWAVWILRSFYLAIGLHVGWILVNKGMTLFLEPDPTLKLHHVVSERYFLLTQPWTMIAFLGTVLCILLLYRKDHLWNLPFSLPPTTKEKLQS